MKSQINKNTKACYKHSLRLTLCVCYILVAGSKSQVPPKHTKGGDEACAKPHKAHPCSQSQR